MKTDLNIEITTPEEAKNYLTELFKNDEIYHPEDSAFDVEWKNRIRLSMNAVKWIL